MILERSAGDPADNWRLPILAIVITGKVPRENTPASRRVFCANLKLKRDATPIRLTHSSISRRCSFSMRVGGPNGNGRGPWHDLTKRRMRG